MYAIHQLYRPWFVDTLRPFLAQWLGGGLARIVMVAMALLTTYLLSLVAYRFIEAPALRWKQRLDDDARARRESLPKPALTPIVVES